MEGGKKHGYGTFTLANGDEYKGEFKNDEKHGYGLITSPSTKTYVGEWKNGKIISKY